MAILRSGASTDELTIDPTSKALRATLYDQAGRGLAAQSKVTFYAAGSFTPVATPTDLVTIFGSASKVIRVLKMIIGTTNTAAGSQQFFLVKRSGVNSGGTFVSSTPVRALSTDPAASATVGHYTANPLSLGTSDGNVAIRKVSSPVQVPATFAGNSFDTSVDLLAYQDGMHKPITLVGNTEGLAINFNGAALVAGQIHTYQVVWTEE